MLPRENLNFLNVRNVGFRHSVRLFRLLQVLSLQNFKNFFGDPPFKPTMFFYPPFPPVKPHFFHDPPPPSNPASSHYLIKHHVNVPK